MVGFPRLGNAAPQSRQLGGGDELVALGGQLVDDVQSGGDGAVRHVVEQNHIPVRHVFQHRLLDGGGRLV